VRPFWRKTPAKRFERARKEHRERRPGGAAALDKLLVELGLVKAGWGNAQWELELGRQQVILGCGEDGALHAAVPFGKDLDSSEEALDLLGRNLAPQLPWFVRTWWSERGSDNREWSLGATLSVPFDGFDRATALLALEQLAAVAEAAGRAEPEVRDGLRRARLPHGGELAGQAAHASAREAVRAALEALDVPAGEEAARPGTWRLSVDDEVVELVLGDTGESLMLLRDLPLFEGPADLAMARYLLGLGDFWGARIGFAEAAGEPVPQACAVVPAVALGAADLAYGLQEVLTLAEAYEADTPLR